MASVLFGTKGPDRPHLIAGTGGLAGEVADLRDDLEETFVALEAVYPRDDGYIGNAELVMSAQPVAGNTIGIGADTYEFDGVGANINVTIAGSAALTRAALITAINTLGTEAVFADENGNNVRIQFADAAGGTPIVGTPTSMVLTEVITDAADVWNQANLNATGGPAVTKHASGTITVTAENLATLVELPMSFTPVGVLWLAFASGGIPKATTATVVIDGDSLKFDFDAGGTPLVATDYVQWLARG